MARPLKTDEDKKCTRLTVYVDDETEVLIKKVCEIKNISVSGLLCQLGTEYSLNYFQRRDNLSLTD